jgi:hypothetical protein
MSRNGLLEREAPLGWNTSEESDWIEIPQARPQMRLLEGPVDVSGFDVDSGRVARFVPYTGNFEVL